MKNEHINAFISQISEKTTECQMREIQGTLKEVLNQYSEGFEKPLKMISFDQDL